MGCQLALALVLLSALSLQRAILSEAFTEGGPSPFSYDASSACSSDRQYSRIARARRLPCDFKNENWCNVAGNDYPWQAVKKFVQENQGLMKRMYGDEKHISVIKNEFNDEDVEIELEDANNRLYYEDGTSPYKQYKYELDNDITRNSQASRMRELYGRSFNGKSSSQQEESFEDANPSEKERATSTRRSTTSAETSSTTSTTSPMPSTAALEESTSTAATSTNKPSKMESTSSSGTPIVISLEQIANVQNLSINEVHGQIDRIDSDVDDLTEIPITPLPDEQAEGEVDVDADVEFDKQQFRPRPEYRPSETTVKSTTAANLGGQLYQDVAVKDKLEGAGVLKVRGINACPVVEEVVAPFWANNTRGEVLALLNIYPFEQYVHWEKCSMDKQQYCRDGCRCEQQYRLHRLLAYDPSNGCRGIFLDWFKFPSCCICKCYFDLPLEFRVASRSPRQGREKRKLKVQAPQSPPPAPRVNSRQSRDFL